MRTIFNTPTNKTKVDMEKSTMVNEIDGKRSENHTKFNKNQVSNILKKKTSELLYPSRIWKIYRIHTVLNLRFSTTSKLPIIITYSRYLGIRLIKFSNISLFYSYN